MRLESMTVRNFRSVQAEGDQPFGENGEPIGPTISFSGSNIIFLIGQNNAGKSSFLTAYEYLVSPKCKAELSDFSGFQDQKSIQIFATFVKESADDKHFEEKGLNKWVDPVTNRIRFMKEWKQAGAEGQKSTYNPVTKAYEEDGFGGFESHFKKHAPDPIRIPAMPSPEDLSKWVTDTIKKSVLKTLSDKEADACKDVIEKISQISERLMSQAAVATMGVNANRNFQKVFPDLTLKIDSVPGPGLDLQKALEKEFTVTVKDARFPDAKQRFSHQGHGVVRQIMFNFLGIVGKDVAPAAAAAPAKTMLILFEEPEIYLHPKCIRLLRDTLYSLCGGTTLQILCASHSPSLIDLSQPHTSIARLVRDDQKTCLYQAGDDVFASDEERKSRVQMINRFDPHVTECFFADDVILVEGDTEAIVVRELLHRLDPTRDIFVVNTGSKTNIPFFQDVLTHFHIRHHVIHDTDTRFLYEPDGTPVLTRKGEQTKNSAWKHNQTIWQKHSVANEKVPGLSKRYVCLHNYEEAHGYVEDSEKGKPLSAFEHAQGIDLNGDYHILKILRSILKLSDEDMTCSDQQLEERVKL